MKHNDAQYIYDAQTKGRIIITNNAYSDYLNDNNRRLINQANVIKMSF